MDTEVLRHRSRVASLESIFRTQVPIQVGFEYPINQPDASHKQFINALIF